MTLQELLGENFKDDITIEEIDNVLSSMKLADLSKGGYVEKNRLTDAENTIKSIKKEYGDYRASKQTEEERKAEETAVETARVQGLEKELAQLKMKEQLIDNGFSKDEIKYLMDNEQSPSAFAKIMSDRVETATSKTVAKDIKDNTIPPAASNTKLSNEPTDLKSALKEKYQ